MASSSGQVQAGQDTVTKLKELVQMKEAGLITQAEFDQLKTDLMSQ